MKATYVALRSVFAMSFVRTKAAFVPTALKRDVCRFSLYNLTSLPTKKHNYIRRFLSSSGDLPQIHQIGKAELEEILEDIENGGREETGYVVIDVRGTDEIAFTGKLNEKVETLPLPAIAQMGVFDMGDEAFEDAFGFTKPSMDETIIFLFLILILVAFCSVLLPQVFRFREFF